MTSYAELQVTTNFSFLRGASHIEELFAQAKRHGLAALGITDRNSLAGIVRAHQCAAETGLRLVVGCRLDLRDGTALLVYPTDRPAYSRLCRLLTLGKARAGKGKCDLAWQDLAAHAEGLLAILVPDAADAELAAQLGALRRDFGDRAYLALTLRRRPGDAVRLRQLADMAQAARRGNGGHRRRAVSCAAAANPPGRGDLHPRGSAASTPRGSGANVPPTATSSRRRKWLACSPDIRRRSRAHWKSSSAAASACPSCATSIPMRLTDRTRRRRPSLKIWSARTLRHGIPTACRTMCGDSCAMSSR